MSGGFGFPAGSMIPMSLRGGPWVDQVPRQRAFEKAHPEVEITFLSTVWQAAFPDGENAVQYVTCYELGDLLDELEERFPLP
jgi:hypothetical protein